MKRITHVLVATAFVVGSGCAMFQKSPAKGSDGAGQKLLSQDQRTIEKADANYRDAVLKHGESSDEAVKAKTVEDNAKNQYAADQQHVQQLQQINGAQSGTSAPTISSGQPFGNRQTTTTTTTTVNPQ